MSVRVRFKIMCVIHTRALACSALVKHKCDNGTLGASIFSKVVSQRQLPGRAKIIQKSQMSRKRLPPTESACSLEHGVKNVKQLGFLIGECVEEVTYDFRKWLTPKGAPKASKQGS